MVLDLLEGIGGFYGSADLLLFMLAEFFSARFFIMSFSAKYFMLKKPKSQPDGAINIDADYEKITYSTKDLIFGRKKELIGKCEDRISE